MEPAEIIADQFWNDSSPVDAAGGELPCLPGLENQVLFRTSGSSGKAKWVALSKSSLIVSATAVNRHLNVSANDCWGLALPLRHVGGFGVAARAFAAGCRLACFNARWNAASYAAWID
ncbi:MAG: hypothetical protein ACO3RV_05635, partial [Luteolibacter sp.]